MDDNLGDCRLNLQLQKYLTIIEEVQEVLKQHHLDPMGGYSGIIVLPRLSACTTLGQAVSLT